MPTEVCRMRVSELQKRLAEKATTDTTHRFDHLYDLLTWDPLLDEALTRLMANKGSRTAGLDGMHRGNIRRDRDYHLRRLRQMLKDGTFRPSPVRRVYIPKRNGKRRPLGIPTFYDRWVQMALKLILEPIFESDFAPYSHGFRPKRSCHTAIAHARQLSALPRRKVHWVVEGDIEGCFDHVHHKKLMTLLRQRIRDKRVLDLIWQFLRAGVMEDRLFTKTAEGTPQGGVLSPLLANIYLNHFDRWFADRVNLGDKVTRRRNRLAGHANFMMVRYADDFIVFSNGTRAETEAFKAEMAAWFADELHLTLSAEKTAVTHYRDGIDFLGFTLKKRIHPRTGNDGVICYPSTTSVQRAVRRVAELTERSTQLHSAEDQIDALNAFLRGWAEYFRHSSSTNAIGFVAHHAHMRMWKWLVGKYGKGRGWRAIRRRFLQDGTWCVNGHRLTTLPVHVDRPVCRVIPNPYLVGVPVAESPVEDPYHAQWTGYRTDGSDWPRVQEAAMASTNGTCVLCGAPATDVHHITARRQGGGNEITNLVPLCRRHHRAAEQRNNLVSHQLSERKRHLVLESRMR